jgi:hypothetical protein
MDYWSTAKKVIQSDLKMSDVPPPPTAEHRGEDSHPNYKAKIDHHHPIIQYPFPDPDGEATLYMVQNCERKK